MRGVRLASAAALLAIAGCSTTGSIAYVPSEVVQPGPPASVGSVTATDARDEKPNRLATIRGGYGNPVKVFDTDRPVADEVADAFTNGLRARGMLGAPDSAPFRFQIVLHEFYASQYLGAAAHLTVDLRVVDRAGRVVYTDTVKDKLDEGAELFVNGVFADIDHLRKIAQDLMNRTVDQMLDKPGLRAVLRRAAAGRPAV